MLVDRRELQQRQVVVLKDVQRTGATSLSRCRKPAREAEAFHQLGEKLRFQGANGHLLSVGTAIRSVPWRAVDRTGSAIPTGVAQQQPANAAASACAQDRRRSLRRQSAPALYVSCVKPRRASPPQDTSLRLQCLRPTWRWDECAAEPRLATDVSACSATQPGEARCKSARRTCSIRQLPGNEPRRIPRSRQDLPLRAGVTGQGIRAREGGLELKRRLLIPALGFKLRFPRQRRPLADGSTSIFDLAASREGVRVCSRRQPSWPTGQGNCRQPRMRRWAERSPQAAVHQDRCPSHSCMRRRLA